MNIEKQYIDSYTDYDKLKIRKSIFYNLELLYQLDLLRRLHCLIPFYGEVDTYKHKDKNLRFKIRNIMYRVDYETTARQKEFFFTLPFCKEIFIEAYKYHYYSYHYHFKFNTNAEKYYSKITTEADKYTKKIIELIELLKIIAPIMGNDVQLKINKELLPLSDDDLRNDILNYCNTTPLADSPKSSGEIIIEEYLRNNHISYKTQYDTLKCFNPSTNHILPYDIEFEHYKIIIEIQGQQHIKYTPYFHSSFKNYLSQKERDEIKKRYATSLGYLYIELKYEDIKNGNYKKIINDAINKCAKFTK